MPKQAFDAIATFYDKEFTHTYTGRLQRAKVYELVSELLEKQQIQKVLELNCGTGEDALWLVRKGSEVLATDISESMVEIARQKSEALPLELAEKLQFQTLAAESVAAISKSEKFDLIFSNFGGINCLSPEKLRVLAEGASQKLQPGGSMVMVVMGRKCLWESFYFLLKGQWKKAWRRRNTEPVIARLSDEESILTWYYGPQELYHFFSDHFQYLRSYPIGLALPPSYLDPFFHTRPRWMKGLLRIENWLGRKINLSNFADHFIIFLQKKEV